MKLQQQGNSWLRWYNDNESERDAEREALSERAVKDRDREISTRTPERTLFTEFDGKGVSVVRTGTFVFSMSFFSVLLAEYILRADRPALLVSSTSWSEDEDFELLLNALKKFDADQKQPQQQQRQSKDGKRPRLFVVITGQPLFRSFSWLDSAL